MRFDVITIFPDLFNSFKREALISRAQEKKIISINTHFLRDYTEDAHRTVDDRPYGGGAGMVLMVEPILKAVDEIKSFAKASGFRKTSKTKIIVFSPKGKKFDQAMARRWSKLDRLIMICGRYEGIDERVAQYVADEEISIGDYVLFGGEVPAMVVMEAVTRLIPGAIGKQASLVDESFNHKGMMAKLSKRLEYPHYTRPKIFVLEKSFGSKASGSRPKALKARVPKVLLSGDHQKIEDWRKKHSQ